MNKTETDPPERLRLVGAADFERRLLEAARREQPSSELSARMAQAIGVSMPQAGNAAGAGARTGKAAFKAASASSSLPPWVSGALATAVVVGAFLATRPRATPSASPAVAAPAASVPAAQSSPLAAPPAAMPRADAPSNAAEELPASVPAPLASPRGRSGTTAGALANQIALVDAARAALAGGGAERALAIVREYQAQYPTGTFRPEVAAVKIEALVKLGRTTEARTLAERFVAAHGASPLADRVARLAGLAQPRTNDLGVTGP